MFFYPAVSNVLLCIETFDNKISDAFAFFIAAIFTPVKFELIWTICLKDTYMNKNIFFYEKFGTYVCHQKRGVFQDIDQI